MLRLWARRCRPRQGCGRRLGPPYGGPPLGCAREGDTGRPPKNSAPYGGPDGGRRVVAWIADLLHRTDHGTRRPTPDSPDVTAPPPAPYVQRRGQPPWHRN